MNVSTFENGRVVLSTQGRDKGRLFIVLESVNDDFVLIADGDLRLIAKPKLKRKKHLKAIPYIAEDFLHKQKNNKTILDSDLKAELNGFSEVYKNVKR